MTLSLLDLAWSELSLPNHSAASSTSASLSLSELGGEGDDFPTIILVGRVSDAKEAEVKVDVELPAVDADNDNDSDDTVLVLGLKRGVPGLETRPRAHKSCGTGSPRPHSHCKSTPTSSD